MSFFFFKKKIILKGIISQHFSCVFIYFLKKSIYYSFYTAKHYEKKERNLKHACGRLVDVGTRLVEIWRSRSKLIMSVTSLTSSVECEKAPPLNFTNHMKRVFSSFLVLCGLLLSSISWWLNGGNPFGPRQIS